MMLVLFNLAMPGHYYRFQNVILNTRLDVVPGSGP